LGQILHQPIKVEILEHLPFEAAGGLDLKNEIGIQAMPVPIANLGIGLPKGFDLKVRFVPTL
jgi:hypothetical protein